MSMHSSNGMLAPIPLKSIFFPHVLDQWDMRASCQQALDEARAINFSPPPSHRCISPLPSTMNRLRYIVTSILLGCLGSCLGGFLEDPTIDETIHSFYDQISKKIPVDVPLKLYVPVGLTRKQHLKILSGSFEIRKDDRLIHNLI
ncbi:hypothetical protein PGT21_009978, partial [Puccinia graminis f. sp. tritici]